MQGRWKRLALALLTASLAHWTDADAWSDGLRAYDAGDYGAALAAWRRAADRGHAGAMTAIA